MNKILSLILISTAICISLAHRNPRRDPWFYGLIRPFTNPTSICANNETQATYLARTNALINNFQLNSAYNSVLQIELPKFIVYIKDPSNQALLYTNCTAFINGVKAAKLADQSNARTRKQIALDICRQIRQVSRNVTGSNGLNDLDIPGVDECG
ncbi:unnamed protein product [Rotaria sordida]|uniref:Uncharacterized protein n=1 Tax=Rotaria sordida TaxID=392033 RepID=A0A815FU03_9BILA|nr:unnamed protein product [Rotaria sordida]CAF4011832.1 unnamed protein product [Rotaria sordida]